MTPVYEALNYTKETKQEAVGMKIANILIRAMLSVSRNRVFMLPSLVSV